MGEPKHLIEIGGVTMLERTVGTIRRTMPSSSIRIVSSSSIEFADDDLRIVFDIYRDRGAWSGLHAALANSSSEWTFVIACDYPLMSGRVIERLAGLRDHDVDAVVALQADGRPQPLCAYYRTSICREVAESLIVADGTPAIRAMYDMVRTKFVAFADLGVDSSVFMNVNSREDLEKARSLFESRLGLMAE